MTEASAGLAAAAPVGLAGAALPPGAPAIAGAAAVPVAPLAAGALAVATGGSGATGIFAAGAAAVAGPAAEGVAAPGVTAVAALPAGVAAAGVGLSSASLPCGVAEVAEVEEAADFWLDGATPSEWPAGVRVEGAPEQPVTAKLPAAIAAKTAPEPAAMATAFKDRDTAPAALRSRAARALRALLPPKPCFIAR